MKLFLFFLILLILLFFINNRERENFSKKVIGDISYGDYEVSTETLQKFFSDNLLAARTLDYTLGIEGQGINKEVSTLSFNAENMKGVIPEAVETIDGKELVNLEAIVPILFEGLKSTFNDINKLKIKIEELKGELIESKKNKL